MRSLLTLVAAFIGLASLAAAFTLPSGNRSADGMGSASLRRSHSHVAKHTQRRARQSVTMADAKAYVDGLVSEHRVMVFAKPECPYCQSAINLMAMNGAKKVKSFKIVYLDNEDPATDTIQDYLQEITGARTVPRIFADGKCIGGSSDVEEMKSAGTLRPLFASMAE
ncbi:unnamed protein product [Vitrella brassicaformis CCMP3155]|uniref:Glutaredoxin domain-containing protein n=1 Tax=Vitrella brassicaformis (strain CCMP3155) TaxID=1169540 RepID=A0A0G4FQW3_VITBC|nr:unnamed protein product [Vitrella brassicaformis CCMP3155]|eukprot:CEM16611.1 unnamed protein product [Vitrella brassicaformis CCMP3155]